AEAQAHPSVWAAPSGPSATVVPRSREARPAHPEAWAPPVAPFRAPVPAAPAPPAPEPDEVSPEDVSEEAGAEETGGEPGFAEAEAVSAAVPEPSSDVAGATETPTETREKWPESTSPLTSPSAGLRFAPGSTGETSVVTPVPAQTEAPDPT